jgi:1,4-dihydroxy-2-naphthoate octaprenyltransferase
MAIRPMSLFASVAPILVGSAVAIREGGFAPLTAAVALLVAMLLQILSNLANDLFDFRRGADRARVGPARVVQSGLVSERRMEVAIGLVVLLALLGGLHLVWRGGWPILLLGLLALLCAVAYTGGPFPLGYHGLGDLFVFIFFGLVGVAGSAYVQTRDLTLLAVLCALPIACLATAIIVPNNLRDIETDRAAGKRTLAVRIGPRATVSEYLALLAAAYLIPPVLCLTGQIGLGWLLTLVSAPLALALATHIRSATGRELVPVLIGTSRLTGLFGLLFAIGIAL